MSRGILAGLVALLLGVAAGCPTTTTSGGPPAPASRPAATEPGKSQPEGGTTPKASYPEHIPADR
jgi:hypothetical protein